MHACSMHNNHSIILQTLFLQCRSIRELTQLHSLSIKLGHLPLSLSLTSSLLLSYSSLRHLSSSLSLFNLSPLTPSSAFLWNSLSRAFSSSGMHEQALVVYNRMMSYSCCDIRPDGRSFPFALTAAARGRYVKKGLELHGSVVKFGFSKDVFVGNTLLNFYGACGSVSDAGKVFEEMGYRDIVSWNSVLSVFTDNGLFVDSLNWFLRLRRSGFEVNEVSLVSVIPACASIKEEKFGKGIHSLAVKNGLSHLTNFGNALVDMYGCFDQADEAIKVFDYMPVRNEISWNSIIGSLVHVGLYENALKMFRNMFNYDDSSINSITISSFLPALVELGCFNLGKEIHCYSLKRDLDSDVYVSNSLIDMYAKFGFPKEGKYIFERIKNPSVVSWNTMIYNYAQNNFELEAIGLLREMIINGENPNPVTFANLLPACARIASLKKGKEIHAFSIRKESIFDLYVSNAFIDMYAKCGQLNLARKLFDWLDIKDDVSYNTMIVGYSQSEFCIQALELFTQMRKVGIKYDMVSYIGALSACANLSTLKKGKEIHCQLIKKSLSDHLFIVNGLLELYTKVGNLQISMKIFEKTQEKDVASWNTLILGHAMNGELNTTFKLFDEMKLNNIDYDHVSYIAVLSACSHGGLVNKGKKYFSQMLNDKNIKPRNSHYSCMVDLLGRAGLLKEAENLIKNMPILPDSDVWGAMLGACRIYGNVELGKWAAKYLFELKPNHSGYYMLLCNLYMDLGRFEEADEVRRVMKERKVEKNPGFSWVESGNRGFVRDELVNLM